MYDIIRLPSLKLNEGIGPGDALVSANVLVQGGSFAEGVNRGLHLFMNLCSLLEAAVLHERLFCLPTGVPSGSETLPVVRVLLSEGVLWKIETDTTHFEQKVPISALDFLPNTTLADTREMVRYATGELLATLPPKILEAFKEVGVFESCRQAYPLIGLQEWVDRRDLIYRFMRTVSYLSVANAFNVSYLPNFNRLAIVQPILRASLDRIQSNFLARAHEQIKSIVAEQEDRLRLAGREIDLSLPPLVSVIFERARASGNLESAVLSTRAEFEPIRRRFKKYARLISSDEVPLSESLRALDILEADLRTIAGAAKEGSSLRMLEWRPLATFLAGAVDNPKDLESAKSWTDLALKLLKMPLSALASYIRCRRVQPLLELPRKIGRIEKIGSLTEDVLGWRPPQSELPSLRRFAQLVTKPVSEQAQPMKYEE